MGRPQPAEFAIEMMGGPRDGLALDLVVFGIQGVEEWPPTVYVARYGHGTVLAGPLPGWDPDVIAQAFWAYRQTSWTNDRGRRVYVWDQMKSPVPADGSQN